MVNGSQYSFKIRPYWFGIVIIFGLGLRLIGLDNNSLWLDEVTSLLAAQNSLENIVRGKVFDNHTPPLYYVLIHFWLNVFPYTETGLRLFSALVDGLNMVLLVALFRRFTEEKNLFLILAAYALSPFMLYYSQEGRMYTLVVFFALSYCLALERLVRTKNNRIPWSILAGSLLAAGVYTHYYFAFFVVGVWFLGIYSAWGSKANVISVAVSGLIGVVLFLPWVPVAWKLAESGGQSFRHFTLATIPYTLFRFIVGYAVFPLNMHTKEQMFCEVISNLPAIIAVFGCLSILTYCIVACVREGRSTISLGCGWIVAIPGVIGLLASLKSPMFSERYMIVVLPFFYCVLLGSLYLSRKSEKAAVSIFFLLLIIGDGAYFLSPRFGKTQWRQAAQYVQGVAQERDIILVEPFYTTGAFQYYFKGNQRVLPLRLRLLHETPEVAEKHMYGVLAGYTRVALVTSGPHPEEGYAKILLKMGRKESTKIFPFETGITCTLWLLDSDYVGRHSTSKVDYRADVP